MPTTIKLIAAAPTHSTRYASSFSVGRGNQKAWMEAAIMPISPENPTVNDR
jgi:hypothetical protein